MSRYASRYTPTPDPSSEFRSAGDGFVRAGREAEVAAVRGFNELRTPEGQALVKNKAREEGHRLAEGWKRFREGLRDQVHRDEDEIDPATSAPHPAIFKHEQQRELSEMRSLGQPVHPEIARPGFHFEHRKGSFREGFKRWEGRVEDEIHHARDRSHQHPYFHFSLHGHPDDIHIHEDIARPLSHPSSSPLPLPPTQLRSLGRASRRSDSRWGDYGGHGASHPGYALEQMADEAFEGMDGRKYLNGGGGGEGMSERARGRYFG
ncbi:hypothetical protein JCM8547_001792 [Rhodosporidiobolus lusitaniae]